MKKTVVPLIIILLCFSLCGCSADTYSRAQVVLGDAVALRVSARGNRAKAAVNAMFEAADEVFSDMDLSDPGSTLSLFNESGSDAEIKINRHIFNVLTLAKEPYEKSGGAFDVTAYPLSLLWGVDNAGLSGKRQRADKVIGARFSSLPSAQQIERTLSHVGMDKISFYERDGEYYLSKSDPETKIDLGGIAKGYFTDVCVRIAKDYGLKSCLIDLSGNLYLYGKGVSGGGNWTVGIIDPRPRLGVGMRLHVAAATSEGDRSFVTSGDYQRFYYAAPDGAEPSGENELLAVCHIINAVNGLPVGVSYDRERGEYVTDTSAVCSAVVSGENSALCDAYSTAVCVLGAEKGAALLKEVGLCGMILTSPDGDSCSDGDKVCGIAPVALGKGKMTLVGEWDFIDGYDAYKTYYESESA